MNIRRKSTFVDHIRRVIGDTDKILFTDDELDCYIEAECDQDLTEVSISCNNAKWRVCGCSSGPVKDLNLVSGYHANGVYAIDEISGTVVFDATDPLNLAPAPADGDQIVFSYYRVCVNELLSELFMILSSNHAKLKSAQSIMGVSMNLTELADSFWTQSCRFKAQTG